MLAATPPIKTNRTPCRWSAERIATASYGGSGCDTRLCSRAEVEKLRRCPLRVVHALGRRELQVVDDVRDVGLVVVRHPEGELEAAGADQLAQRLEARLDVATFPAGDLRLRPFHPPPQLGLGDPDPQARLLEQICTEHQYGNAIKIRIGDRINPVPDAFPSR